MILLNGTSSSGKSTLAAALQEELDEPYFHVAVDQFHRTRARKDWTEEEFQPVFQRTVLGFHRVVAGMASAGNNVVADHILGGEAWRMADCMAVLDGYDVVVVGVHCALPELERRERERGNRGIGRAAFQYPIVHTGMKYDVEVDTGAYSPEECAQQVKAYLTARST
ncbi:chloramphenicol phosphotransferase CPT family protein [Longispora albida]|uniref:chloramphenicol phosphotransferase CPT family protein n=1 Tax=Longispora albida TaxID=203523 RepID=UPI0003629F41|nr:AAA family ATPase [Longispora albida]